jgi:hypothetical protein
VTGIFGGGGVRAIAVYKVADHGCCVYHDKGYVCHKARVGTQKCPGGT